MNAQTAHTPRTDAQIKYYTEQYFGGQRKFTEMLSHARTLERENALLVEQNERMRQALASAWTAQTHLIAAKHLREPIYGATNYAPIGGPIATAMDYIDKALEGVSFLAKTEARAALNPPPTK